MSDGPERGPAPILEFDPARRALIEPSEQVRPREVPRACVITFFGDVIERLRSEHGAHVLVPNAWEDGPHDLYGVDTERGPVAFFHPGVGGPLAAGLLEEVIAFGCSRFVLCGGAGALAPDLALGHVVLVDRALRDEGTSYHYLPAARWVRTDQTEVATVRDVLERREVPLVAGATWTTDAPYRETPEKIASRRGEGCLVVDMEAASLLAVAEFRGVTLVPLVYAGDDLSGEAWDHRGWQNEAEVRQGLFWLAAEAALALA